MPVLIEDRTLVTPGEVIAKGDYKTGDNVYHRNDEIVSQVIGLVSIYKNNVSVTPLKEKYIPEVGDIVIGKVVETSLNSWVVDIGEPYPGILKASSSLNRRFNPTKDKTREIFDVSDVLVAKIFSFDRTRDPLITLRKKHHSSGPYLGKLVGGRIINISPSKIPRLIGRRGSMINMIKQYTNTRIIVGQNGRVWIKGESFEDEYLVIQAIEMIEREAHTKGLTDRVKTFLEEKTKEGKNKNN
jgi:exosome complex component RRP4